MIKKEIYLKDLGRRGDINIWLVDGLLVRRDVDKEFVNFGQHFRFSCIPINEFWLDKEANPDERKFFIDHLLIEWQNQKDGLTYKNALAIADKKEASERKKAGDLKKVLDKNGDPQISKIHIRMLREINNNLAIWLVDGRLVRSVFDLDFTEGGHDQVYDYVPKNEVWLDNDILEKERPYIILHELFERKLMTEGKKYNNAHEEASKIEWEARHNDKKLQEKLKELGIE